jgi:hypothetical protein
MHAPTETRVYVTQAQFCMSGCFRNDAEGAPGIRAWACAHIGTLREGAAARHPAGRVTLPARLLGQLVGRCTPTAICANEQRGG